MAPWSPPIPGGLLAQPPRLDATCPNHSASHREEENIPVLGTERGLAIPAKSSMMVWTRLHQVLLGVIDVHPNPMWDCTGVRV